MSGSSFVPEIIKGGGQWASGTTVREIEGHFNKSNEPKDAAPISGTGGVPGVDYAAEKAKELKDKATGHSSTTPTTKTA